MKYLIIFATIMWGVFFYANAKALDCIPQMEPMSTDEVGKSE